jgi:hypothetical protein
MAPLEVSVGQPVTVGRDHCFLAQSQKEQIYDNIWAVTLASETDRHCVATDVEFRIKINGPRCTGAAAPQLYSNITPARAIATSPLIL